MTVILDPFEHLKREGSLEDFEGWWLVILKMPLGAIWKHPPR